jgi:hypothetical protein
MGMKRTAFMVGAVLFAGPLAANAASITYDFTGTTVYAGTGVYSSVAAGQQITGSLTFDLAEAIPTDASGTVGSTTTSWVVGQEGGTLESPASPLIPSGAPIFAYTASVGESALSTPPPGAYYSNSEVGGASNGQNFYADNTQLAAAGQGPEVDLNITNPTGAYNPNGLPLLAGATSATGIIQSDSWNGGLQNVTETTLGDVEFNITSLTPVPLPAATWLMLSGLCGLGAFMRKPDATSPQAR